MRGRVDMVRKVLQHQCASRGLDSRRGLGICMRVARCLSVGFIASWVMLGGIGVEAQQTRGKLSPCEGCYDCVPVGG